MLQTIALHDTITVAAAPGPFRIACSDPACPVDRTNLVWRAADRLWQAAGRRGAPRDVAVRIEKRIPLGSGLAGGSSDAAAAIRALSRLWGLNLPRERRLAVAASIGADVPFFLHAGTALGVDRGDALIPLADMRSAWVTIVVPSFGIGTKDAYSWWDLDRKGRRPTSSSSRKTLRGLFGGRLPASLTNEDAGNDLERAVATRHPEIARIVQSLVRAGASHAAMSGSGSAVFGLFSSRAAAVAAAARFAEVAGRVAVTETITRRRHASFARLDETDGARS